MFSCDRADLIVVMFDAHKLDISDELKMVIDTLKPHHDKMRYDYKPISDMPKIVVLKGTFVFCTNNTFWKHWLPTLARVRAAAWSRTVVC